MELSYLLPEEQRELLETIESEDCTPSLSQAVRLRKLSGDGLLTMDRIFEIMTEVKGNQVEMLKIPTDRVRPVPSSRKPPTLAGGRIYRQGIGHYAAVPET